MAEKKEKAVKKFWETPKASKMAKAYSKGSTIKELAEMFDVTTAVISKTLKYLNVETRPRGRRSAAK